MVEPVDASKLITTDRSAYKVKGSAPKDYDRQKGDFYEEITKVKDGQRDRKKHSSKPVNEQAGGRNKAQGRSGNKSNAGASSDGAKKEKIIEQGNLVDIIA